MNTRQVYERVCLVMPMGERQFFDRLNDVIAELNETYGEVPKLLWKEGAEGRRIKSLDTEIDLLELYHAALAPGVLALAGAEAQRPDFTQRARNAWLTYWNRDAKGRRIEKHGPEGGCCRFRSAEGESHV